MPAPAAPGPRNSPAEDRPPPFRPESGFGGHTELQPRRRVATSRGPARPLAGQPPAGVPRS